VVELCQLMMLSAATLVMKAALRNELGSNIRWHTFANL
jgi:hypothetical protein